MRIHGFYQRTISGLYLPVFSVDVLRADGGWEPVKLLLDTGAERTVFCFRDFDKFGIEGTQTSGHYIMGVGGRTGSRDLDTKLRFTRADGPYVTINGPYMAFTDPDAADMSVLGRDVLDHFALVMDRPRSTVCLLHGDEVYP